MPNAGMTLEHYKVRLDGKRLIVAVVEPETLTRIEKRLLEVGCHVAGPTAWWCEIEVKPDLLASAVGELAEGEVVYLASDGEDRAQFGFIVAPNTESGIAIG